MTKKYKKYKIRLQRPNAGYSGALIQQNFGEGERKGFLVWNIRTKDDWDVKFHKLENKQPFITIKWEGNVENTLKKLVARRGEDVFLPGTRFRVSSSHAIPNIETRKLIYQLKENKKASEVVFKHDIITKLDRISTNNFKVSKKSLREDPDAIVRLYFDYISSHEGTYIFDKDGLDEIEQLIRTYMSKLLVQTEEKYIGAPKWSIKSLEFDNLFRYGENNKIDFSKLEGITGIFGSNRVGKSSIIGALMFTLFNTTDRGSMKNAHIINASKNYGKGKVRFSVAGVDYIVERQCSRVIPRRKTSVYDPTKSVTTLSFSKVEIDPKTGKEINIPKNSISRDDTDKEIRKLIGTADDFLDTAFSSQDNINRFIKKGPTDRKKILSRFLELDIFENLYSLCKEDYNQINSRGSVLSVGSISNKTKNSRKAISKEEKTISVLDTRIAKLREQKDAIKLWLMHHEKSAADIDLGKLNSLEKTIDEYKENIILNQEKIKSFKESHKNKSKNLKTVEESKAEINIDELKTQLVELEKLRNTLQEIKHNLATEKSVLSNQQKNVKKLNIVPCDDKFPDCHYIRDGHRDKKKINSQNELVNTLLEQYDSNKNIFQEMVDKKIQEEISLFQKLDRETFDLKHEISFIEEQQKHLKTSLSDDKNSLKKAKAELSLKKKKVDILMGKEFERKKNQLVTIHTAISAAENKRHEALVSIGGKKESLKNLLSEEQETKTLIKKLKIFDSILVAFSKTGIPAMVLKSQLPAINEELAKILDGIVDFAITLDGDDGSNAMDVHIEDGQTKRIIELASGMEKTIASLALRVALVNLSSLPKSDIFILDEGFGSLDDTNIHSCLEMLAFLREYFRTILIISHLSPVKEIADHIIDVADNGVNSYVNV